MSHPSICSWNPNSSFRVKSRKTGLSETTVSPRHCPLSRGRDHLAPPEGNAHWYLVCYEPVEKVVSVIDSLHDDTPEMPVITMYKGIGQLDAMNLFCALVNSRRYERVLARPKLFFRLKRRRPKQHNSSDCGVFVCMYMDYICGSESLAKTVWSRECIQGFRYKIAWQIMKGRPRAIRFIENPCNDENPAVDEVSK
ncbi:hypothetical protein RJ640_024442 [Escallonia rubra]|uniref:Ubiquitin-like protease family profile domain-containing protein n=1 Tax=Escallonia rubra TaxID=112253 RepID=A0AA88RRS7_9ASTE|nr:hypothetical protein RJ640_024442 [Escallonia rubra]